MGESGLIGRIRNHSGARRNCLQVPARSAGDHAIRNVEIGKAVVIKIKSVGSTTTSGFQTPTPSESLGLILKIPGVVVKPAVAKQGIAHGVFPVECPGLWRSVLLKDFLRGNAFTGSGPHVRDVNVLESRHCRSRASKRSCLRRDVLYCCFPQRHQ